MSQAVSLLALVAKCAAGDCADMGALFEELLTTAAQQRYAALSARAVAQAGAFMSFQSSISSH